MSFHALHPIALAGVLSGIIWVPVASAETFVNSSNKGTVLGPSNSAGALSHSVKTVQAPLGGMADILGGSVHTLPNLSPQQDWAPPVNDRENHLFTLVDALEYRPKTGGGENTSGYRWDIEGWYGGDYNRLWFKNEGQQDTAYKAGYDLDFQLLYGRFIQKYYDFQIGPRLETQAFRGRNVTRGFAAIGIEGIVPYDYTMEATLFIDQNGAVSGRLTLTKDVLLTQQLILQGRFESNVAVQRVEEFTTGPGLNNLEFGMRLRYEIRREFAPYVGFSLDRSFGETATLVRQEGGNPSQIRFVVGVRMWF